MHIFQPKDTFIPVNNKKTRQNNALPTFHMPPIDSHSSKLHSDNALLVQMLSGQPHTATHNPADIRRAAMAGVQGAGSKLPYFDRIQNAFGQHDISHVKAYMGTEAKASTRNINAEAYATGNKIAFAESKPSLHTVAHEATHVLQQQGGVQLKGGIGQVEDKYERQADLVANRVVQERSVESELNAIVKNSTSLRSDTQSQTMGMPVQRLWKVNHNTQQATWLEERSRKRPPYPPYGYQLVYQKPPLDQSWGNLPNYHEGNSLVHTPNEEDEIARRYGASLEVKSSNKQDYPEIGSQIVFKQHEFTAKVTSITGGRYLGDPDIIKLANAKGTLDRGLTANIGKWYYETPLESLARQSEPKELSDIHFGFNTLYYAPGSGYGFNRSYSHDRTSPSEAISALAEFGKANGSKYYGEWGDYALESPMTNLKGRGKAGLIKNAMELSGVIRFNIDGLTNEGSRSVKNEFSNIEQESDISARNGNFTVVELYLAIKNFLFKTLFYSKGELIDHEEAQEILGITFSQYSSSSSSSSSSNNSNNNSNE